MSIGVHMSALRPVSETVGDSRRAGRRLGTVFERFTDRARRVLVLAQEEARDLNHSFIGTEHILLGLIHEGEGLAARALGALDISLDEARAKVSETIDPPPAVPPSNAPPFTPRAKKVLELSLREALQLGQNYIGTEHMLLGLVREGQGVAATVLDGLGADLRRVRQQVIEMMGLSAQEHSVHGVEEHFHAPFGSHLISNFDWPVYPARVLAGPQSHLTSADKALRIVGLLFFDNGFEVKWERVGGVEVSEHHVPYITIGDNFETRYQPVALQRAPQPDKGWTGRTFFVPQVPDGATVLRLNWTAETVEFEL
jgi:hypothetical protein